MASPAHAATLTVCPSGCDHTTIAAAVAAATAGDIIDIGAGTHTEAYAAPEPLEDHATTDLP